MYFTKLDIKEIVITLHRILTHFEIESDLHYDDTDNPVLIAKGLGSDGKWGTGAWIYKIKSFSFCSKLNDFFPQLEVSRKNNESGILTTTSLFMIPQDMPINEYTMSFWDDSFRLILKCLIPGAAYYKILQKSGIDSSTQRDLDHTIKDESSSIIRHVKIQMLDII